MRVVVLSTDPGIRFGGAKGAAVHLAELAGAMAARHAGVLLLVADIAPGARAPRGVTLERLPGAAEASVGGRITGGPDLAGWLERRLRAFGAEALYERAALHSAAGAAAALRLAIPYLVELNAPLPQEAARYRRLEEPELADSLERSMLSAAGLVFAVSRPLAEYARLRGAADVEVMPNAVAIDRFPERPGLGGCGSPASPGSPGSPASPASPGSPASSATRPRAVFLGALRPWHGIETIARAWEMLGPAAPELLVVGDGPGRERLAAIGAMTVGSVDHEDVPDWLAQAEIGLAPYAPDAPTYFSPLKLFEYLASGLAVIAGALPGVTDIVTPRTAWLIPPGDAAALADGVRTLVTDPGLRFSLGRAGRALVVGQHTWDRRAERVLEVIRSLARPEPAAARQLAGLGA
jgi:glycosyltransferase involved in cell wall biosynthesis